MKIKSYLQVILPLSLAGMSLPAVAANTDTASLAANTDTVMARQLVIEKDNKILPETDITVSEKEFTYDWTKDGTVRPDQEKISKLEKMLQQAQVTDTNKNEKEAMGNLLYRLGTYYNYVTKDPERAITTITNAANYIDSKQAKVWNTNQLAYAYELRYEKSHNVADKDKAVRYSTEVTNLYHGRPMREIAFAYWVQGLIAQNTYDFDAAEKQFQKSLAMYDVMHDSKNQQYERTKMQLASLWTQKNYQDVETLAMLQEQSQTERTKPNYEFNPDSARNSLALVHAYLKVNNPHAAMHELNKSVSIYQNVYGSNATWVDVSDTSAASEAQLNNDKLGTDYQYKDETLSHNS